MRRGNDNLIGRVLEKEDSDFKYIQHSVDIKIIKSNCPQCNSDVLCAYADTGTTEYCDTYHHICMNLDCGYIEKKDIFGIGMGEREYTNPSPCPFCGRDVK